MTKTKKLSTVLLSVVCAVCTFFAVGKIIDDKTKVTAETAITSHDIAVYTDDTAIFSETGLVSKNNDLLLYTIHDDVKTLNELTFQMYLPGNTQSYMFDVWLGSTKVKLWGDGWLAYRSADSTGANVSINGWSSAIRNAGVTDLSGWHTYKITKTAVTDKTGYALNVSIDGNVVFTDNTNMVDHVWWSDTTSSNYSQKSVYVYANTGLALRSSLTLTEKDIGAYSENSALFMEGVQSYKSNEVAKVTDDSKTLNSLTFKYNLTDTNETVRIHIGATRLKLWAYGNWALYATNSTGDYNSMSWGNLLSKDLSGEHTYKLVRIPLGEIGYKIMLFIDGTLEASYMDASAYWYTEKYSSISVYVDLATSSSVLKSATHYGVNTVADSVTTFNKVENGENFIVPAYAGNELCFGWYDNKNAIMYETNDTISSYATIEAVTIDAKNDEGASPRFLVEGETNLKWIVRINKADLNALVEKFGVESLAVKGVLTAEKSTAEYVAANVTDVTAQDVFGTDETDAENHLLSVVLTGIKTYNYVRNYTVTYSIALTVGGETYTVTVVNNNNTTSVAAVAYDAVNNHASDYTQAQLAILRAYIPDGYTPDNA